MNDWVVDCSLVLAWCLPDERSSVSDSLLSAVPPGATLRVPALFWYEAANALAVALRRGRINPAQADDLGLLIGDLPLETEPATPSSLLRLTILAQRHTVSAYDAAYLDLARRSGAHLVTLDRRLHDVAKASGVPVLSF